MFESKINRGKANGYAPLDGSGKVPLDKLPPIQSTIDTGSFVTTGSNTFVGNQTISGSLYFGSGSNIYKTTDASIIVGKQPENVQIFASDTSGSFWRLFVLYSLYPNLGTEVTVGNTVTTDWGTPVTATIQEVIDDTEINDKWVFIFDEDVLTGFNGGPQTATFEKGLGTWTFGDGGILKLNNGIAEIYADPNTSSIRIGTAAENVAPNAQIIIGGGNSLFKIKAGPPLTEWNFDGYGNLTTPGDIIVSGSVNISSSLVVASGVVSNGTIDALNSDLIIEGGYLILTGSEVPTTSTGSTGDKDGMVTFDNNFLYYCTTDYTTPITGSNPTFEVTGSGTTHVYDIWEGEGWNGYHDPGIPRIQTGPSQEDGGTLMPEVGWYMVDDLGSIKEIISSDYGFPIGTLPAENGIGFLFDLDTDYVYSDANTTLTFYETIPTVNIITPGTSGSLGSGEIWTKTKLDKGPNYAPMASGSWDSQAIGEVTQLDITKDIHLLDTTGAGFGANFHWYLPNGLYDGQVVRFALKGDNDTNPTLVRIWMNNIRTYNGTIVSSTTWYPFWDDGSGSPRSLATALYIDGAWNIDTDYWDM